MGAIQRTVVMSIYADLHVHTTESDGELTLDEVPDAAKDAGVHVVGITDHDRIHSGLDETIETCSGVTLIRGIELRVQPDELDERVDLLGYGVERTDALTAEITRLQENRIERAETIIRRVESECDVRLDVDVSEGIGRPHIARAIAENNDLDVSYDEAFEELIGRDSPAYTARDVTSFERGRDLLDEACDIVGLAHPYRYREPEKALALTETLDAVEAHYPYSQRPKSADAVRNVIQEYGLLPTGGSDVHDTVLGRAGIVEAHYDMLEMYLSG